MSERLERARRWIEQALDLDRVELAPASADASFRRYFRFESGAGSMILMDAPPGMEDSRPYVAVSALLADAGVHVPAILALDLESGFLLLEDLGTRSYMDALDDGHADALYADAVETLIAMQRNVAPDAVGEYAPALVRAELELFTDWFLDRHLGIDPGGRIGAALARAFDLLVDRFDRLDKVFVHRDYHSRNLMRTGDRNPGVLDFQDAVAGPAAYDVISLFRDVYVEWPEARVEGWMRDYHARAHAVGVPVPDGPEEFLRDADFVGAQRHIKIAGIFCRLFHRDGKADYLRDIPLTLRYLARECARRPELGELGRLLEELDLVERLRERQAAIAAGGSP